MEKAKIGNSGNHSARAVQAPDRVRCTDIRHKRNMQRMSWSNYWTESIRSWRSCVEALLMIREVSIPSKFASYC